MVMMLSISALRAESPSIFLDLPDRSRKIEGDSARRVVGNRYPAVYVASYVGRKSEVKKMSTERF